MAGCNASVRPEFASPSTMRPIPTVGWALHGNRTHSTTGALIVTQNTYPREDLVETILRYVKEQLAEPTR
ncbi:hypothetical protein OKW34_002559 [Paraburkholderia youngii]